MIFSAVQERHPGDFAPTELNDLWLAKFYKDTAPTALGTGTVSRITHRSVSPVERFFLERVDVTGEQDAEE